MARRGLLNMVAVSIPPNRITVIPSAIRLAVPELKICPYSSINTEKNNPAMAVVFRK